MSEALVERFVAGLRHLEQTRDPERLVPLFADDAEVGNVVTGRHHRGTAGVRDFWRAYAGTFRTLESRFRNLVVGDGLAALEWETSGTTADGASFRYDGVSILESAGEGEAERITRFRAYFDPAALGRQVQEHRPEVASLGGVDMSGPAPTG